MPQLHHTSYAAFGVIGQFDLRHDGVFAVVNVTIYHGVAEILHGGVCRQRPTLRFRVRNIRGGDFCCGILSLDVLHRFGKLGCKAGALKGRNSQVMAILGAFHCQFAQHHLRVLNKVAVDSKAILGLAQLHPVRLMVDGAVTLL